METMAFTNYDDIGTKFRQTEKTTFYNPRSTKIALLTFTQTRQPGTLMTIVIAVNRKTNLTFNFDPGDTNAKFK